ncbi:1,4-dihydroxy-6-naphthoate synthase [Allorhodopirellula heiligendammensis]|uniref:1,4-dihydroxy-6-naphtoate synthase n=1 Tax=Allorhodopirellula heiligendammensis TaxID=2714739 RepID=A0A5C6BUT6_9BACT|nr:1,4-dihydroxy-6-naphthoate synthase [Allorhodopirellula heiligendammensis]TWU15211.1 1,4-dihydroxy-6-naphtoate synthase [Allorhodopirellula heiligendammensis]
MSDPAPQRIRVGSDTAHDSGRPLHLGISTCPNDTFAFAALLEGRVDTEGLPLEIDLLDIDQLNRGLIAGQFDLAKVSFNAALSLGDQVVVLPVGSALGFGVGPLLLASNPDTSPRCPVPGERPGLTLCPGEHTTAKWLFDQFYPDTTLVEHVVFSDIMPRLADGTADFGVCIHEGRFTYEASGLHRVTDLGELWEQQTRCPLPLGGLVMRQQHDHALMRRVSQLVSRSLAIALESPETALPAMRKYAQSMEDAVLMQHVDLYVNDWTVNLGNTGRAALLEMAQLSEKMRNNQERRPVLSVLS